MGVVGLAISLLLLWEGLGKGGGGWFLGWKGSWRNSLFEPHIPARLGLKKDIKAEPAARTTRSGVVKGTCPG